MSSNVPDRTKNELLKRKQDQNRQNQNKNTNQKNPKEKIVENPEQKNPKEKIVQNPDQKNPNQNINESVDEKNIIEKGVTQPPPIEIVSIGINIGAQNTIYSSFGKFDKNFISKVLLSDVSSRKIPSIIVYTDGLRLYGEPAKARIIRFYDSS